MMTMTHAPEVEKVRRWIADLTDGQEIQCDYWPQPDNSDPYGPSWALMDLSTRQVLDFIDQSGPGPDHHNEIAAELDAAEEAGRVAGVACGFYRTRNRAAADAKASEGRARFEPDADDVPF